MKYFRDVIFYESQLRTERENIVTLLLQVDEKDTYRFIKLKEDLLKIDYSLKNYTSLVETIKNDNMDMLSYFKVYKRSNFTFLIILGVLLSIVHILYVLKYFNESPSILNSISLFIVPFALLVLINEYAMLKICKIYPKLIRDIVNNTLIFRYLDYKCHYLINLYDAKVFREFRLYRENWIENKIERLIISYGGIFVLFYFFPENILLCLFIGLTFSIIFQSLYRSKVGGMLAHNINKIYTTFIKINLYSVNSGVENMFKVFGYSIFSLILQLVSLLILILLKINFKENEDNSKILEFAMNILIFSNLLAIIPVGLKALIKSIYLKKSLFNQRRNLKSKVLRKLKKFPDRVELLNILKLLDSLKIDFISNTKRVSKFVFN